VTVYQFLKGELLPGAPGLLLLLLVICVPALWWTRTARAARYVLAVSTIFYVAISIPVGAWWLSRIVAGGYEPVVSAAELDGVQAIAVLDGGAFRATRDGAHIAVANRLSVQRALEAARLYRMLDHPLIVVSGGDYKPPGKLPEGGAMRDVLLAVGVPGSRILLDSTSRNTQEHGENVPALLRRQGITRFALVTSAVHMPRALRAFWVAGARPVPAPAPIEDSESPGWWPSSGAIERSREALYEVLGRVAQRMDLRSHRHAR
jgi:uncharacterized SAM-binding protein YcdF (DUF218 family)